MAFRILEGGEFYPVSFGVHITPDDPRPMLEIGGSCKVGNAYMRLSVDDDLQSPAIKLYDRDDNVRAELSLSEDGKPHFELCETADAAKEAPLLPAINLCDYERLSLDFRLKEDGDKVFNFEFVRGFKDSDEIYFNTEGVNRTSFNRDGYSFPLRDHHKGEIRERITLPGKGELEFLGFKNERAFLLIWRTIEGQFEAEFNLYDAKGDVVQTFSILE